MVVTDLVHKFNAYVSRMLGVFTNCDIGLVSSYV